MKKEQEAGDRGNNAGREEKTNNLPMNIQIELTKALTHLCSSDPEMVEMRLVILVKCPAAKAPKSSQRMLPGEKPTEAQTLGKTIRDLL